MWWDQFVCIFKLKKSFEFFERSWNSFDEREYLREHQNVMSKSVKTDDSNLCSNTIYADKSTFKLDFVSIIKIYFAADVLLMNKIDRLDQYCNR